MQQRILVLDAREERRNFLVSVLVRAGCQVIELSEAPPAEQVLSPWPPDLILIDTDAPSTTSSGANWRNQMPHVQQIGVCRADSRHASGADSLVEPLEEKGILDMLEERLPPTPLFLTLGETEVNLQEQWVRRDGETSPLTSIEADLLSYLATHQNRAVHRRELLGRVWGYNARVASRAADSTVKRVRKKVEADPSNPAHLKTVFGVGYRLIVSESPALNSSEESDQVLGESLPSALPAGPVPFIGREEQLKSLDAAMTTRGVLTLTGPGGVGKTALVLSWAARHMRSGQCSQVLFCDMASVGGQADVLACLAATLGVNLNPGDLSEQHIARCGSVLSTLAEPILVIDNAEDALKDIGECVESLLEWAPEARIVVTSRVRLGIASERCMDIEPLRPSDGVRLFTARVAQMGGGEPKTEETVQSIVERLDGLPLGIELAAAQCRLLLPNQLLSQLNSSLSFLQDVIPARPDRHQRLWAAIEGSWLALTEEEQRVLSCCSLFTGTFSVAAGAALADRQAAEILPIFLALREKSLVQQSKPSIAADEPQMRLLHSVREYAGEKLQGEERERAEMAHCLFFLERGERVFEELKERGWSAQRALNEAAMDIRAAAVVAHRGDGELRARMALVVNLVLSRRGPLSERIPTLSHALSVSDQMDPHWVCRLLKERAWAKMIQGQGEAAIEDLETGLAIAEAQETHASTRIVLTSAIQIATQLGRFERAREYLDRLESVTESTNWRHTHSLAFERGSIDQREGRFVEAAACFQASMVPGLETNAPLLAAHAWYKMGFCSLESGNVDQAEQQFFRALSMYQRVDRSYVMTHKSILALVAMERDELDLARELFESCTSYFERSGDLRAQAEDKACLGWIAHMDGDLPQAAKYYKDSMAVRQQVERTAELSVTGAMLAAVYAEQGQGIEAMMALGEARSSLQATSLDANHVVKICEHILAVCRAREPKTRERALEAVRQLELQRPTDTPEDSVRIRWAMKILKRVVEASSP